MLDEAHIQRYARQILLGGVGGVGQERLLQRSVRLIGQSAALDVCASYLAAGGSKIEGPTSRTGFLAGADLDALNGEARRSARVALELVASNAQPSGQPPFVWLFDGVAIWVQNGCLACASRRPAGAFIDHVLVGAAGALLAQRALIDLQVPEVSVFLVTAEGLAAPPPARCEAHASF